MKRFLIILLAILLLAGIIAGVYLVKSQQNIKSKAGGEVTRVEVVNNNGEVIVATSTRSVKLKLTYVPQSSPSATEQPSATASASSAESTLSSPSPSPQNIGVGNSSVQGITAAAQEAFPTHFRLANFQTGLEFAKEQLFTQNSQLVNWRLSQGNGQKRVYAQFKVNGLWQDAEPALVDLSYTERLGPQYGMQIDIRGQEKIPTQVQADLLKPAWVRFVYPCTESAFSSAPIQSGSACPNDWHKTNLINSIPNPGTIKRLAVINGESAWGSPVGSTDVSAWRAYIDNRFLPVLKEIAQTPNTNLSAIELWNEEDHNSDPTVQPYIPAQAYAYLLKSSSALIRSINHNLDIVTGGVLSGDQYLKDVKAADSDSFSDIDAIGIHPYVIPENIQNITTIINSLKQSNLSVGINIPVWVTEVGIQEFTHTTTPKDQKEFMESAFNQFVTLSPVPQLVNWYAFIDLMGGSDNSLTWGLVKADGTLKPSGEYFKTITSLVVSPTPSPSASSSASPAASPSPTPSLTPRPTNKPSKLKDFNGDGKINSFDVSIFLYHWASKKASDIETFDLNEDNRINSFDYSILKSGF